MMKPLKRALVKIGERDRNERDVAGYYYGSSQQIFLVRAFYESQKHLEDYVEGTIEHETLHHILLSRINHEACEKLDNIHDLFCGFYTLKVTETSSVLHFHLKTIRS